MPDAITRNYNGPKVATFVYSGQAAMANVRWLSSPARSVF